MLTYRLAGVRGSGSRITGVLQAQKRAGRLLGTAPLSCCLVSLPVHGSGLILRTPRSKIDAGWVDALSRCETSDGRDGRDNGEGTHSAWTA